MDSQIEGTNSPNDSLVPSAIFQYTVFYDHMYIFGTYRGYSFYSVNSIYLYTYWWKFFDSGNNPYWKN